ncbi:DUF6207 family protein [Streptomyces fimbriatus]|uniref:DUF6207 family protein n=1 Tax=Streptomyces fimbriatus TaxID=68197 RepID=A0ABW0DLU4_STRFI
MAAADDETAFAVRAALPTRWATAAADQTVRETRPASAALPPRRPPTPRRDLARPPPATRHPPPGDREPAKAARVRNRQEY